MDNWCGNADPRVWFLDLIFMVISPIIVLYFVGNYLYCKITGRVFLEAEQRELEEAKKRPPIILGGKV